LTLAGPDLNWIGGVIDLTFVLGAEASAKAKDTEHEQSTDNSSHCIDNNIGPVTKAHTIVMHRSLQDCAMKAVFVCFEQQVIYIS
jgi:hypothetical protein